MPSADYAKAIPSGVVITGGNCDLPGIVELGRDLTQLPVRVGSPSNMDGGDDMLYDPAYATSVGLLYWKMKDWKMKDDSSQDNWAKMGELGVLLPRWLGYFSSRNRQFNRRLKEMKNGKSKLRAQPS
jgi:cell division ATPase FtsA